MGACPPQSGCRCVVAVPGAGRSHSSVPQPAEHRHNTANSPGSRLFGAAPCDATLTPCFSLHGATWYSTARLTGCEPARWSSPVPRPKEFQGPRWRPLLLLLLGPRTTDSEST